MIEKIVKLTAGQMKTRYPDKDQIRRGVHPKDHGCVMARFQVKDSLPEHLRIGVFALPGHTYGAWIRFSNAALRIGRDASTGKDGAAQHGSRGMAVKLMGVTGNSLVPTHGPLTQDFLMINQPVFAFSNVEDYLALNEVLSRDGDVKPPVGFFTRTMDAAAAQRAKRTREIIGQIQSAEPFPAPPFAFQKPPASPVDNRYFSGSPFLFGEDRIMKFSASPLDPSSAVPNTGDEDYLRTALLERLTAPDAKDIVFDFQVQVRAASSLDIETEIEDACGEWREEDHPFVTVATIAIPPQNFDTDERKRLGEDLTFTPWHGIAEHRPLGGINRLRLAVYEASTQLRHVPPEPAHY